MGSESSEEEPKRRSRSRSHKAAAASLPVAGAACSSCTWATLPHNRGGSVHVVPLFPHRSLAPLLKATHHRHATPRRLAPALMHRPPSGVTTHTHSALAHLRSVESRAPPQSAAAMPRRHSRKALVLLHSAPRRPWSWADRQARKQAATSGSVNTGQLCTIAYMSGQLNPVTVVKSQSQRTSALRRRKEAALMCLDFPKRRCRL